MTASIFSRFRNTCSGEQKCGTINNAFFIKNHVGSTEVEIVRTSEELPAVLIFDNGEGVDNVLLYTCIGSDVVPGDYYTWKGRHFIVTEDITIVKEIGFKKQRSIECNTKANDSIHIAFIGNARTYKDTKLQKNYEGSGLQPLVIVPNGKIEIDDYVTIGGYRWRVVDGDTVTLSAVNYLYLDRVPNTLTTDVPDPSNVIFAGSHLLILCDNGIAASPVAFTTIERTATSITISVPFGITTFPLSFAREGEPVTVDYIVKGG